MAGPGHKQTVTRLCPWQTFASAMPCDTEALASYLNPNKIVDTAAALCTL